MVVQTQIGPAAQVQPHAMLPKGTVTSTKNVPATSSASMTAVGILLHPLDQDGKAALTVAVILKVSVFL